MLLKKHLFQKPKTKKQPPETRQSVSRLRLAPQAQVQLAQLLLGDRGRGAGEEVLAALGLRERDDIADRVGARHESHHAVEAERDAAVRRRAVLQGVQEEAAL